MSARRRTTLVKIVVVLLPALLLALQGCGGDSPAASAGPDYQNILGTFAHTSEFFVARLTELSTGNQMVMRCGGSMSITSQDGGRFSGSFRRRTCWWGYERDGLLATDVEVSGTVSGTIRTNGDVVFSAATTGRSLMQDALAEIACTAAELSTQFTGPVAGPLLSASAVDTVTCPTMGQVQIQQSFGGDRR